MRNPTPERAASISATTMVAKALPMAMRIPVIAWDTDEGTMTWVKSWNVPAPKLLAARIRFVGMACTPAIVLSRTMKVAVYTMRNTFEFSPMPNRMTARLIRLMGGTYREKWM